MSIELTGNNLTVDLLTKFKDPSAKITLSADAIAQINRGRRVIDNICEKGITVYGINTGFGSLCDKIIPQDQITDLQTNLILSHCSGVGPFIPREIARMVFTLRINVLARGNSGISLSTLESIIAIFNAGLIPCIPSQGSVGASGDLAPLSHMVNTFLGNGFMFTTSDSSPKESSERLKEAGITPIVLKAKEGLALINGTQFIMAFGTEAFSRAETILKQLHLISSCTLEALLATPKAFHAPAHLNRPHPGQIHCASKMRETFGSTESKNLDINGNKEKVQDAYSLRCIPQVHGVAHDTLDFVKKHLEIEMNSSTDNPLVFWDEESPYYDPEIEGYFLSAGNFHGEYPAKMLDFLSIAIHEIGSISERRIERMVNSSLSEGLPSFLIQNSGLCSGFMIVQYAAAAIVSENKHLASPASIDTIPTCENKEDHVSMGAWSARKSVNIVENVEKILAMELYCACQAIDLRGQAPNKFVAEIHSKVRKIVPFITADVNHSENIEKIAKLLKEGGLL